MRNFGNTYSGTITLANATAFSDNSVYARLGIQGLGKNGTTRIARMATKMGIRSPVSNNYAMILGGLKEGVTPLDMAHAYETFAEGGRKVFNPKLGAPARGPDRDRPDQLPQLPSQDDPRQARLQAHPPAGDRGHGAADSHRPRAVRYRHGRSPVGRGRRRQDRNDVELRRRVVRRLDAADDDRGLGRLPQRPGVDGQRLPAAARSRAAPTPRSSGTTSWRRRCRSSPPKPRPRSPATARPRPTRPDRR